MGRVQGSEDTIFVIIIVIIIVVIVVIYCS